MASGILFICDAGDRYRQSHRYRGGNGHSRHEAGTFPYFPFKSWYLDVWWVFPRLPRVHRPMGGAVTRHTKHMATPEACCVRACQHKRTFPRQRFDSASYLDSPSQTVSYPPAGLKKVSNPNQNSATGGRGDLVNAGNQCECSILTRLCIRADGAATVRYTVCRPPSFDFTLARPGRRPPLPPPHPTTTGNSPTAAHFLLRRLMFPSCPTRHLLPKMPQPPQR